ncbi:YkgJ family cysteine cluster protein [Christiangramia salexigens]|uniref:Zinc/iron-chelating domain-containing protein n=1 Tax=Christiangramia salexigens TaxID=1913577 RepID=A0A1L3J4K4_9FLAO|nr:YkgJ family cysteine cluster protein [Christiangramia salexigens]APG60079.1 zinc/iron-chelating domain-containing protein [Christiangramia salexigens]
MEEILKSLPEKAKDKKKENKKFFSKLKKRPPKNLDSLMLELHEDEFSRTDCLECANCCKTTGPLFTQKDIERLSKHFKMKPGDFIDTYLRLDEDNDYVLQVLPCPFLGSDNYCSVYDVRPKACREFPHTDRKDFHKISNITIKNTAVCPAAFNIVEEMKRRIKN